MALRVDRNIFLKNSPAREARAEPVIGQILEDPLLRNYRNEVRHAADKCRATAVPALSLSLFRKFDEGGDRSGYEAVYFERRRRLVTLGLASWLWKRQEDIKALEDCVWAICDEFTWALPAHLGNIAWTSRPTHLDLFACETGFALAEITAILEGVLCDEVIERAGREVHSRVLDSFSAHAEPWNWELMDNNWCAVCAGSIGAAALYLEEDPEKLAATLGRITPTLNRFIAGFPDDGACLEGVGYWTYGVGFFLSFSDILERATVTADTSDSGAMGEFATARANAAFKGVGTTADPVMPAMPAVTATAATEKFHRIAAFQRHGYLNGSIAVSFSDGSSGERYRIGLARYIEAHYPECVPPPLSLAAGYSHDKYGRWCLAFRDILWSRHDGRSDGGKNENHGNEARCPSVDPLWLPEAQWLICPASRQGSLAFAAKGGNNDEPHNHNDVGAFELVAGEAELLADLGCGEYTRDYFGDARYSIFCNSSLGHSLPIVDGHAQSTGQERRAADVKFRNDGRRVSLSMDIASAYDYRELLSLVRRFEFDGEYRLCVQDTYRFASPSHSITERFISRRPEKITLGDTAGEKSPSLHIACSVAHNACSLVSHSHREHDGREVKIKSLDFTFNPRRDEFSVSFEFTLIS